MVHVPQEWKFGTTTTLPSPATSPSPRFTKRFFLLRDVTCSIYVRIKSLPRVLSGDVILSQEGTTQGDPLAMPMYGLATIPLIRRLDGLCKQIWYADDSAAIETTEQLHVWWNRLAAEGPAFGYFPNPSKTWLVTKQGHFDKASNTFPGSGVKSPWWQAIPWCSDWFPRIFEEYVSSKVRAWSSSINVLSDVAKSQPQAAFSALMTHGLLNKWTYLRHVVPDSHLLVPLDEVLKCVLSLIYSLWHLTNSMVPAITGRSPPNDLESDIFALLA